jgi:hypothetical protein
LDPKCWAEQTFGRVQLHDMRRARRAVKAANHLAETPPGSLPAQMQNWKETKAFNRKEQQKWQQTPPQNIERKINMPEN